MLVGHALVAEVLGDLVHLLEAADDQPLQVELVRDAEVDVLVEVVRVRHERLGEGAAVARLQDRRLDFEEPFDVEVGANRGDHPAANGGVAPRLLVHQQVEVPLAVANLGVGDAVERVRQRAVDLAEQHELVDGDRGLAATGLRRSSAHADEVSEVDVDRTGACRVAEQLDPCAAVDEVEEDELPQLPAPEDASCHLHDRLRFATGLELLRFGTHCCERHRVGKPLRRHVQSLGADSAAPFRGRAGSACAAVSPTSLGETSARTTRTRA